MKEYCTKCGKPIKINKSLYLELDTRDNQYYKCGTVPQEHSQGAFPFGANCIIQMYKKQMKKDK